MNDPQTHFWSAAAQQILVWMIFVFFGVLIAAGIKWAWGLLLG